MQTLQKCAPVLRHATFEIATLDGVLERTCVTPHDAPIHPYFALPPRDNRLRAQFLPKTVQCLTQSAVSMRTIVLRPQEGDQHVSAVEFIGSCPRAAAATTPTPAGKARLTTDIGEKSQLLWLNEDWPKFTTVGPAQRNLTERIESNQGVDAPNRASPLWTSWSVPHAQFHAKGAVSLTYPAIVPFRVKKP